MKIKAAGKKTWFCSRKIWNFSKEYIMEMIVQQNLELAQRMFEAVQDKSGICSWKVWNLFKKNLECGQGVKENLELDLELVQVASFS